MKNKNGFTLVELLAVIAILAILVVIALPNVLEMFNSAKRNTFITELQEIVKTAQSQYVLDGGKAVTYSFYDTNDSGEALICTNSTKKLDMQGTSALHYKITIDAKGNITNFYAIDANYSYKYDGPSLKIQNIGVDDTTVAQGDLVDVTDTTNAKLISDDQNGVCNGTKTITPTP